MERAKARRQEKRKTVSNNLNTTQFAYDQRNVKHLLFSLLLTRRKILNDFFAILSASQPAAAERFLLPSKCITIAVLFSFIALIVSVGSLVPYWFVFLFVSASLVITLNCCKILKQSSRFSYSKTCRLHFISSDRFLPVTQLTNFSLELKKNFFP